MTGQVENTRMTPMQTLDSLRQQIVADGKVTQEEIQVFEQNCNTMLANKEITDEDFNEAIGWFKNTSVEKQPNTPMQVKYNNDFYKYGIGGAILGSIIGNKVADKIGNKIVRKHLLDYRYRDWDCFYSLVKRELNLELWYNYGPPTSNNVGRYDYPVGRTCVNEKTFKIPGKIYRKLIANKGIMIAGGLILGTAAAYGIYKCFKKTSNSK